jgi:hypothetical protein
MTFRYSAEGLSNFGKWIYVVRHNRLCWPQSLREHYPISTSDLRIRRKISQAQLVNWFLKQYPVADHQFLLNVYSQCERWRHLKSIEPGIKTTVLRFELALILAKSEFLIINGRRIDCDHIWVFYEVMNGSIDPFYHLFVDQDTFNDIPPYNG